MHNLILPEYQQRLNVLYESNHFAVIDKPSGLPSSQTKDGKVIAVENMLAPQKRGGPWLAHRLDRDTQGCLLIAKRKTALIQAQNIWNNRSKVTKTYWAIVSGQPNTDTGTIENTLLKISNNQGWKMECRDGPVSNGQHAKTKFSVLNTFKHNAYGELSLLELSLLTGRTHQARVHCASLGTVILGDQLYGSKISIPLALLARGLTVETSEETVTAVASLPKVFRDILPKEILEKY